MIPNLSSPLRTASQLMDGLQKGDPSAVEELVEHYSRGLLFFLRRRGIGEQDAAGLCGHIFLSIFKSIRMNGVRDPEALPALIWTVAGRSVAAYANDLIRAHGMRDPKNDAEANVASDGQIAVAHQVLAELSSRDREMLVRYYLREQPPEQICADMARTDTQFRILKSGARRRFTELGRATNHQSYDPDRRSAVAERGSNSATMKIA